MVQDWGASQNLVRMASAGCSCLALPARRRLVGVVRGAVRRGLAPWLETAGAGGTRGGVRTPAGGIGVGGAFGVAAGLGVGPGGAGLLRAGRGPAALGGQPQPDQGGGAGAGALVGASVGEAGEHA